MFVVSKCLWVLDNDLKQTYNFSSANSINIARLIPQSFYYFESYKQLKKDHRDIVYSVPSGNLGNLTAGLFAKKMGLPIDKFISANNSNDSFHKFLKTGKYNKQITIPTISNAMDVGDPSNFLRIFDLYSSTWNLMTRDISSTTIDEDVTKEAIREIYQKYQYISDPHGAVGYASCKSYLEANPESQLLYLATAHSSKFINTVEEILNIFITIPDRLLSLKDKKGKFVAIGKTYEDFKAYLLSN